MSNKQMKVYPLKSSTTNKRKLYHEAIEYTKLSEFHFHVPVFFDNKTNR